MATHDYVIANQSGAAFRTDLNNALAAIVSNNSNSSEPATKYAYQWWADTSAGVLKIRNSANNGWIELLQLDGTLTLEDGSASTPALAFRDDLDTGIFSSAANTFDIATAGSKRLIVDSVGRVGIGNILPNSYNAFANTLVVATSTNTGLTLSGNDASANYSGIQFSAGTTVRAYVDQQLNSTGRMRVFNMANGFLEFGTNNQVRMHIDSSGKVGIGTTSPSQELTVAGSDPVISVQEASVSSQVDIGTGTATGFINIQKADGTRTVQLSGSTDSYFTGGNVGIGISTPASLLHVSSGTTSYFRFQDLASETIGLIIRKNTTSTYTAINFKNANGNSGNLTVSTGSVSLANDSDYRLKENETVISDGITKIKQLIPRRFNFKTEPSKTLDGFFAHEVSGVVPEAVFGEKDATIDEDGNGYQSLDATKLIPILTAGLKEAISKIETLETKVAALEAA